MRKLTPRERYDLALTIAGEIDPSKTRYGTDAVRREIAAILGVVENRYVLNTPGAFGEPFVDKRRIRTYRTLSDVAFQKDQFSTWKTSKARGIAKDNYARYKKGILDAIDDYFGGYLKSPVPDATHYYSLSAMADRRPPNWDRALVSRTDIGPHTFGHTQGGPRRVARARALDEARRNFARDAAPSYWPQSPIVNYQRAARSMQKAGLLGLDGRREFTPPVPERFTATSGPVPGAWAQYVERLRDDVARHGGMWPKTAEKGPRLKPAAGDDRTGEEALRPVFAPIPRARPETGPSYEDVPIPQPRPDPLTTRSTGSRSSRRSRSRTRAGGLLGDTARPVPERFGRSVFDQPFATARQPTYPGELPPDLRLGLMQPVKPGDISWGAMRTLGPAPDIRPENMALDSNPLYQAPRGPNGLQIGPVGAPRVFQMGEVDAIRKMARSPEAAAEWAKAQDEKRARQAEFEAALNPMRDRPMPTGPVAARPAQPSRFGKLFSRGPVQIAETPEEIDRLTLEQAGSLDGFDYRRALPGLRALAARQAAARPSLLDGLARTPGVSSMPYEEPEAVRLGRAAGAAVRPLHEEREAEALGAAAVGRAANMPAGLAADVARIGRPASRTAGTKIPSTGLTIGSQTDADLPEQAISANAGIGAPDAPMAAPGYQGTTAPTIGRIDPVPRRDRPSPLASTTGPRLQGAVLGASAAGLPGAIVGGLLGHLLDGGISRSGPTGPASPAERFNAGYGLAGIGRGMYGPRGATGFSLSNPGSFASSRGPGRGYDLTSGRYGWREHYDDTGNFRGITYADGTGGLLGKMSRAVGGLLGGGRGRDRSKAEKDRGGYGVGLF